MKKILFSLSLLLLLPSGTQSQDGAGHQWRSIHADRLRIQAGSALDLTENSKLPRLPDGTLPRLEIRQDGKLSSRLMGFNCGVQCNSIFRCR